MNFGLPTTASHDLLGTVGLGDLLKDQLNADLEERRKTMTKQLSAGPGDYGQQMLGNAARDLLNL